MNIKMDVFRCVRRIAKSDYVCVCTHVNICISYTEQRRVVILCLLDRTSL